MQTFGDVPAHAYAILSRKESSVVTQPECYSTLQESRNIWNVTNHSCGFMWKRSDGLFSALALYSPGSTDLVISQPKYRARLSCRSILFSMLSVSCSN